MTFEVGAPAKINLFLHVGDKRADGYHALQSLVAFTGTGDVLAFEAAAQLSLQIVGPFAAGLSAGEDNLVLKAARALAAATGISAGAKIVLTKNLPVASGIGGGSADCAAALRGLVRLWNAPVDAVSLRAIGAALGSDVPVCIASTAQFMEGRGEVVTPLPPLPALPIVLVNPGVGVPTGKIFAALQSRRGVGLGRPPCFADGDELFRYLKDTHNDLEAPAQDVAPAVRDVLAAITRAGARLSRMSGSGATCFGLFDSAAAAEAAAAGLRAAQPRWWAVASRLSPDSSVA